MQIVIKIPDLDYFDIKHGYADNYQRERLVESVKRSIAIPKNHGRLIDADAFNEELDNLDYDTYNDYSNTFDWIEEAPTIIEADKEVENDD